MSATPLILFIEDADEYDLIQLRQFVKERFHGRGRLCEAEHIYRDLPGDNPNAKPARIGQRAVRVIA